MTETEIVDAIGGIISDLTEALLFEPDPPSASATAMMLMHTAMGTKRFRQQEDGRLVHRVVEIWDGREWRTLMRGTYDTLTGNVEERFYDHRG